MWITSNGTPTTAPKQDGISCSKPCDPRRFQAILKTCGRLLSGVGDAWANHYLEVPGRTLSNYPFIPHVVDNELLSEESFAKFLKPHTYRTNNCYSFDLAWWFLWLPTLCIRYNSRICSPYVQKKMESFLRDDIDTLYMVDLKETGVTD